MNVRTQWTRRLLAISLLAATTGCQSAGGIGEVLGSVLGGLGGSGTQVNGTVSGLDTRNQQLGIRQSNGQTVTVGYDNNTKVVYQNQLYAVSGLETGDEITARVIDRGNASYYTDSVHVVRSVSATTGGTTTTGGGQVQTLQGVVRQIDRNNGLFTLDLQSGVLVTVSMPYNARSADVTRFQNLRSGDQVRIAGVFLNNSRVELRQFY